VRDFAEMLAGAVLVALLAIVIDILFAVLGRLVVSDGLTGRGPRESESGELESEELELEASH
jgi:osmoprotectant transport system permease protein